MELKCSAGSTNCWGVRSLESGVGADSLTAGSRLQPPAQGSYQSTKHLGDSVARVQKLSLIIFGYVFQPMRDLDLGLYLTQRSDRHREVAQIVSRPRSPVSLRDIGRYRDGCAP